MKTLADLKRLLKEGTIVKMTHGPNPKLVGKRRQVVKVQSNGIFFVDPDDNSSKKSFLEFPKASLLDFDEQGFRIFDAGLRDLTDGERACMDNEPRDAKQEEYDALSDGSTMYFRRKNYYLKSDYPWLFGHETVRGKKYIFHEKMVRDDDIKGQLVLAYEVKRRLYD